MKSAIPKDAVGGIAASPTIIRMLFMPRESFPTFRVDVEVLFGQQLLARGHAIDFVMQAATEDIVPGSQTWNGRTVWVGATDTADGVLHRARKHCLGLLHDLAGLRHASPDRYDAVQVKDKFVIAAIALVFARFRGLKFFFWLSFPLPESELLRAKEGSARYPLVSLVRGTLTGWLLYRWILPHCDHVFVQSQRMKEDVCGKGADPDTVTSVPMGIDASDIPALPRKARAAGAIVQLAYIGTLDSERRLDILVEMLVELDSMGCRSRLLLVGDGHRPEDRMGLEAQATRLGVADRLEITGFLPRREALALLGRADICLSPIVPTSILLPASPTKLVEYLALGIPVVANHHPEQRLVLSQSRAGVCVPWGARYFARAVCWLMKHSEVERATMGERGRRWVLEHRTYGSIADALENCYLKLLTSGNGDAR